MCCVFSSVHNAHNTCTCMHTHARACTFIFNISRKHNCQANVLTNFTKLGNKTFVVVNVPLMSTSCLYYLLLFMFILSVINVTNIRQHEYIKLHYSQPDSHPQCHDQNSQNSECFFQVICHFTSYSPLLPPTLHPHPQLSQTDHPSWK